MAMNGVYDKLADILVTAPTGSPAMKTPEFIEILRLQYTPEEAGLAVQVGLAGGKLDEISEKTGIEKGNLKKMLNTMADKGTMWIDPGVEDPAYRAAGLVLMGITETCSWGNVKFPWTVQLNKLWNKFKYTWIKEGLTPMMGPMTPVWPAAAALPGDALPSENILEVIKENDHWSVSPCPCRLWRWLDEPGRHCNHLLETCIHAGDLSRWTVEHGLARQITCDEAIEILRKCEEDGLVHTVDPHYAVCNCCNDCCIAMIGRDIGLTHLMVPTAFVARSDEETCTACKTCAKRCPVEAIEVDEFADVDRDLCIGCGVCVVGCQTKSMRLERRPEAEQIPAPAPSEVDLDAFPGMGKH